MSLANRVVNRVGKIARPYARMFRRPLRAAVVGCGNIAVDHIEAYEHDLASNVVAVNDVSGKALGTMLDRWPKIRAFRNLDQLLTEVRPQIVSVCTWPKSHAALVTRLAESKCVRGILCEKPLALTMADLDAMLIACELNHVKLAGGHQYRFHRHFVAAANAIRGGEIGDVQVVRGQIRSSLANNGPHLFDTIRFLLGDSPARSVMCSCTRTKDTFDRDYAVEESAEGTISFENGVECCFQTGDRALAFFAITVEGTKGSLQVTPTELRVRDKLCARGVDQSCRRSQFSEFVRWVRGARGSYAANGESSKRSAELVVAAYESTRVKAAVAVPLTVQNDVLGQLFGSARGTSPEPSGLKCSHLANKDDRLAIDGGARTVRRWFSARPQIGLPELRAVTQVLWSGQLSSTDGKVVRNLESEVARSYGAPHAVASTSGTAAIHVAVAALGLNPCDEVITTPMSDMGSVIPILACNCVPIFADIDPVSGNLTAETIARRITARTKAILVVHLFGRSADMGSIMALAKQHGLAVIEDCSQAHFAECGGRKVGTWGDFGCFSFQQSKQITCGDGGLTLINRNEYADRAALFIDKGWDRKGGTRSHLFLGMNYRMTELQGAVALAQFRRLPKLVEMRRSSADALATLCRTVPGLEVPVCPRESRPSWWMFNIAGEESLLGMSLDNFAGALAGEGVKIRREYLPRPLFEYDVIRDRKTYGTSGFPFTATVYQQPLIEQFPGYNEFCRRLLLMFWSHRATPSHATAIFNAIRKVLKNR
jgi:perosamine synthetase